MYCKKVKHIVIICSLFFCSIVLQSQQDPVLGVATKKMNNTIYLGIETPITVAVEGVSCKDIKVEITKGTLTGNCGRYKVLVKGEVDTTVVKAFINNRLLAAKTFQLKKVADPKVYILGKTSGFIYKADLIENKTVKAYLKNFRFDLEFKVIGFDLSYKNEGQTVTLTSNSNTLTSEMITALDDLYRDQLIEFKNVRVIGPDEFERVIGSTSVRVR